MPKTKTQSTAKNPAVAQSPKGRDLFIVVVPADTPDGPILPGEIAEAGAKILKTYPTLFRPLAIKYEA